MSNRDFPLVPEPKTFIYKEDDVSMLCKEVEDTSTATEMWKRLMVVEIIHESAIYETPGIGYVFQVGGVLGSELNWGFSLCPAN